MSVAVELLSPPARFVARPRNVECRHRHGPENYVRGPRGIPRCRVCAAASVAGKYRATGTPPALTNARIGMSPFTKAERNAAIVAGIANGRTAADMAAEHGITRERARQIWTRATGRSVPEKGTRCAECGGRFVSDSAGVGDAEHRRSEDHQAALARRRVSRRARTEHRWWSSLDRTSGCWLGRASTLGYTTGPFQGERYGHRFAYTRLVGPIPEGLELDHLCRNRACVNPAHLEPVTHHQNVMRSPVAVAAINARKTHCKHGHSLADAYREVASNGRIHRHCRPCAVASSQRTTVRRRLARQASRGTDG